MMANRRYAIVAAASTMLLGALSVAGCASRHREAPPPAPVALSAQGARMQIISAEQAQCYQYVGIVQGSSKMTGTQEDAGYQSALNEALNKAGSMGGNYLVINEKRSVHRFWTDQESVFATTYKGPAKPNCSSAGAAKKQPG